MIDQQIDTIEIRLMRLERANHRLAWLFGTVVALAALSVSALGAHMLDRERGMAATESEFQHSAWPVSQPLPGSAETSTGE